MKRIPSYSLVVLSAFVAFACSKAASDSGGGKGDQTGTEPPPGGNGAMTDPPEAGATPTGPAAGTEDPTGNPILLGPPRQVRSFTPSGGDPAFLDGPTWSTVRAALFVAVPLATNLSGGKGILTTFKTDGTNYTELRAGDKVLTG